MIEKRTPIPVPEAQRRVMAYSRKGDIERVPITEADGRVLAEAIYADHDIPPFDRSPLDGFAVQSKDTAGATSETPVYLEVTETVGAGEVAQPVTKPGQAVRVMTGTMMPEGCDAICMFELTKEVTRNGAAMIEITRPFKEGDFVSFKGEETKKGDPLVEAGADITPGVKALLATFGYPEVPVYRRPVVGIFATGTELLEVDEPMEPGKIRNSNAYMVASQLKKAGAEPRYFGKLADDFDACYDAVTKAVGEVDALITTGGVSVGDFDYLPAIYDKLGANVLFNKIAMRPGSVTTVAELDGMPLFGLSGNPSACFVGFELYARPWLRTWQGASRPYLVQTKAVLGQDFPKANPFTRLIRSDARFNGEGRLTTRPAGFDKSSAVTSLAHTNTLTLLPGGTRGYRAGDEVDVLLLNEPGSEPVKLPEKTRP
ncbi:molybdopterin molybdotransferase MoeA [Alteribacter natronophilus]|uniref:molybdopterin molybdotransferase MoeA n=1 Tax=Alteribacter natronophilus TaxID=2583810 RepID=UPI00110EABB8|nr:gephyrin-like molybdotransferase Glp [Alteribacter natronophilus]TMW71482.1 molybdopterin molybdotransferase MoeA [Alteribacter natronophilus]